MSTDDMYMKPPLVICDLTLEPNEREGWTIKSTATHDIDLMQMMFNFRIVMTPLAMPLGWDHGWCYEGRNPILAVAAAVTWNPDVEPEPLAFSKRACPCVRTLP